MGEKISSTKGFTDSVGHSTLSNIASADKFNRWMYETITPFCEGETLEVGGGIGNISQCFLLDDKKLTVTELRDDYCDIVKENLGNHACLNEVISMDIVDPEFDTKYQSYFESFDVVFALNVMEHLEDDLLAISNCKKLLKAGGKLIILVPAFQFLFNSFDRALGHYRRYKKDSLKELFKRNKFEVLHSQYFNFIGTLGWWVSGHVLRKKVVPEGQMKLYNFFVPLIKIIDFFTKRFVGLSVIVVGRKN
ncbi:class I SAM-dependent methyltransferase [Sunxiuqinia sp. A32]|uniref:class I SAM-dependent methyltransferase n=1 Tax=Sunxiuqinia sp. A32 TaxID=3461496 RepID=UPI00404663A5